MVPGFARRSRWFAALAVLLSLSLAIAPRLQAQSAPLTGSVVDGAGAVVPAARITITNDRGAVVRTAISDGAGAFVVAGLAPDTYTVLVEMPLFQPAVLQVAVPVTGDPIRAVLKAGGFADSVVVTARRVEARVADTPQKVDIVDATDVQRSVAADLTDVLKKNAGVDVIQYSGVLSGIGIRGFRPQTSGINKRSLLLIDGRPSGVTNLAALKLDNVERVEVLKGAASAIYGSSAMGGVVNVITRQSRGPIGGQATIGGGSYGTSDFAGRTGGSISPRVDFDVTGSAFNQRSDFRMGNGDVRPATNYKVYDGAVRAGADVGRAWRIEGMANGYHGRDIMTPGDLASGVNSQGRKDLERSTQDARVTGRLGAHALQITGYHASETGHTMNVTTTNPLDRPFLPYLSFESDLSWAGAQVRDAWQWGRWNRIIVGFDYEKVTSVSRSFARTGDPVAPFSADSNKRTAGVYAEDTIKLFDGRTIIAAGGRLDHIVNETVVTPYKTNFTPSEATLTAFNPSVGVKQALGSGFRAHFSFGRAFIPAEAIMLTGFTTMTVGGRTQINQGNPDLEPERSTSFDLGVEWTARATRLDVTVFRTVVNDRFISNVVVSNPAPPAPIVLSVVNGLDAHIGGLEFDAEHRLGSRVGVFANTTHYFNRKERLASGLEQDILNVPMHTIRAGVDVDVWRVAARMSGRYVNGRKDNNFTLPGFPIVSYDNFTVLDATASVRLARQHAAVIAINNLTDAFYYEKLGFPLQGASFRLSYRFGW